MKKWLLFFGGALALLYVAAVVSSGLGWNPLGRQWNFENSAQFGDSFGPLSAVMAAIAAIGAIAAYFSQKEELARAKADSEIERVSSYKRDFENTFFNLVALFRSTVNDIEVEDLYGQNPVRGRDAIKRIVDEKIRSSRGSDAEDEEVYKSVYLRYRDDLGHYFRLFYNIVRYTDESQIDDKGLYVRILRATLSNAEMVLLGINCIYGGGREKFKPLVEKYALLHNISSQEALRRRFDTSFDGRAFGDRDLTKDASN